MTSPPLVSVIVTCYNQEHCVAETITSVMQQTLKNIRCIVVDDGSTDGSARVVEELSTKDDRIQLIVQPNAGVSSARNTGFQAAQGEFIQFLDGDDTLKPDKLRLQLKHFESDSSIDVSYTNHDYLDVSKGIYSAYHFEPVQEYPLEQLLFKWFDGVSLPVHAPLYRRGIWQPDELPYPTDYHERCEDWVFLVLVAMKNAKFAHLNQILCTYRIESNNFTSESRDWNVASILAAVYLQDRIPQQYRARFLKEAIGRTLERYHNGMKPAVLQASKNWQIGNFISRPFFQLAKTLRGGAAKPQ